MPARRYTQWKRKRFPAGALVLTIYLHILGMLIAPVVPALVAMALLRRF